MSTEIVQGQEGQPAPAPERQYTEIELKAIDQGWIPKEEFDGDPSEFIDAPEFVRRGELFDKIERQSREIKQVRAALEAFKVHHSKVKEAEYERALKALQDARKQAFVDGEHERAFALEEKIDEIKQEKADIVKAATAPVEADTGYTEEFQDWVSRNNWYETNQNMRDMADQIGLRLAKSGMAPSKVLLEVEKEIRKEFAHRFTNQKQERPPAVESSTRTTASRKEVSLSADEREIMRKIVSTGVMTEDQYLKELKAVRDR